MNYQLNQEAIAAYTEKYTKEVCNGFFQAKTHITGQEIVTLTSVRQVNLFTVKTIFLNWQKEAEKLHSSIFDYQAAEVRQNLRTLMNSLSKNIKISREHFEPILREAVADTFKLMLNPEGFYEGLFTKGGEVLDYANQFMTVGQYVSIHPKIFSALKELGEHPDNGGKLIKSQALAKVRSLAQAEEHVDDPLEFVSFFAEVVPVGVFELIQNWDSKGVADTSPEQNDEFNIESLEKDLGKIHVDYDDNGEALSSAVEEVKEAVTDEHVAEMNEEVVNEEETSPFGDKPETDTYAIPEYDNKIYSYEELAFQEDISKDDDFNWEDEQQIKSSPMPSQEQTPAQEETPTPEVKETAEPVAPEPQSIVEPLSPPQASSEKEEDVNTLADKLASQENQTPATLADKLKANTTHSRPLKGSIPLNQKIMFQNELFNGNNDEFNACLDLIDQCKDYSTAISLVKDKYLSKYDWDLTAEATIEFLGVINSKF